MWGVRMGGCGDGLGRGFVWLLVGWLVGWLVGRRERCGLGGRRGCKVGMIGCCDGFVVW